MTPVRVPLSETVLISIDPHAMAPSVTVRLTLFDVKPLLLTLTECVPGVRVKLKAPSEPVVCSCPATLTFAPETRLLVFPPE